MQRPKRPGRYHDHNWEEAARPGTPTPEIARTLHRLRERYESSRYDPRDGRKIIMKCSPRRHRNGGDGQSWVSPNHHPYPCGMLPMDDLVFKSEQALPPRPRPPPPVDHSSIPEPLPGPSNAPTASSNSTGSNGTINGDCKNDVITRLLSVLECPVCFEYVTPPILQCREGHLVCSGCRARLDLCPKCRQPFADIRARALEQVAEVVPYPCFNSGCGAMLPLSERQAHEGICPYRQYLCTIEPCSWQGKRSALPQHMTDYHPESLTVSSNHVISLTLTQHVNEEKIFLMQCHDEIFHCVMGVDCQQDIFVGFVMLLGPREKASHYEFELNFKRDEPPHTKISILRDTLEESAAGTVVGINGGINAVVVSFSTLREVIQETSRRSPVLTVYITVRKKHVEDETVIDVPSPVTDVE